MSSTGPRKNRSIISMMSTLRARAPSASKALSRKASTTIDTVAMPANTNTASAAISRPRTAISRR
jgi:hypothetical protein